MKRTFIYLLYVKFYTILVTQTHVCFLSQGLGNNDYWFCGALYTVSLAHSVSGCHYVVDLYA